MARSPEGKYTRRHAPCGKTRKRTPEEKMTHDIAGILNTTLTTADILTGQREVVRLAMLLEKVSMSTDVCLYPVLFWSPRGDNTSSIKHNCSAETLSKVHYYKNQPSFSRCRDKIYVQEPLFEPPRHGFGLLWPTDMPCQSKPVRFSRMRDNIIRSNQAENSKIVNKRSCTVSE